MLARLANDERIVSAARQVAALLGGATTLEVRDAAGRQLTVTGPLPSGPVGASAAVQVGLAVEGEVRAWGAEAMTAARVLAELISGLLLKAADPSEAPLTLAHQRLIAALESSSDAAWDWDLTTDTTYFSPRWFDMLGLVPGVLPPGVERWTSLIEPEDAPRAIAELNAAVKTGERWVAEFRVRHSDGSQRWILGRGRVSARDVTGRPTRMSGVSTDITERKAQEVERERLSVALRQAEKLSAIGQLAGGIAHDFNNQLTAILGAAEVLSGTAKTEDERELIADIITATTRSADLTRKLLAFSRRGQLRDAVVDVHGVVHEVAAIVRRSVDRRITVRVDLDAGRHLVRGDASELQNALLNLSLNARDAMPSGGTLTIGTRTLRVTDEDRAAFPNLERGDYLRVHVTDTGTGMTREVQDRLFEPFFTTKPVGRGTGMGLASVYGTVTSHKGSVQVETAPGRGSTFRVFLPLIEASLPRPSSPSVAVAPIAPCRVLVVDDEPLVRERLERTLKGMGHRVESARGGWEAIDRFSATREGFDVVFLDVVMPDLNGRDVLQALRQLTPTVRVVVTSGFAQEGDVQAMLDAGAQAFLQKPFLTSALMQTLSEALGPSPRASPPAVAASPPP